MIILISRLVCAFGSVVNFINGNADQATYLILLALWLEHR